MTEDRTNGGNGAGLWAQAREGWFEAAPCPEAPESLTIAAYLDGTLDAAARAPVEAWMTVSPEALDFVIAARAAQTAAPEAAPDNLLSRARGLVREPPRAAQGGVRAWLTLRIRFQAEAWRPIAWAAAAAALLVVATGGFELGRLGTLQVVGVPAPLADDLGFGLSDPTEDLL